MKLLPLILLVSSLSVFAADPSPANLTCIGRDGGRDNVFRLEKVGDSYTTTMKYGDAGATIVVTGMTCETSAANNKIFSCKRVNSDGTTTLDKSELHQIIGFNSQREYLVVEHYANASGESDPRWSNGIPPIANAMEFDPWNCKADESVGRAPVLRSFSQDALALANALRECPAEVELLAKPGSATTVVSATQTHNGAKMDTYFLNFEAGGKAPSFRRYPVGTLQIRKWFVPSDLPTAPDAPDGYMAHKCEVIRAAL